MLIEFSVSNFRSIKDLQTLSFVAASINEHEDSNTFSINEKMHLLKSLGIYGANGSGKSNMVKAMWAMLTFIKSSFEEKRKFDEHIQPFKLSTTTRGEGAFFQIVFMIDKKTYRYGFVYDKGKIAAEWLFGTAQKNEVEYYTREGKEFYINKERFKEGLGLETKTREDNLFLNVVFEFNGEISAKIQQFFDMIFVIRGNDILSEHTFYNKTCDKLNTIDGKSKVLEFLKFADTDIVDMNVNDKIDGENVLRQLVHKDKNFDEIKNANDFFASIDLENFGKKIELQGGFDNILSNKILSKRKVFDENKKEVGLLELDFDEEASEGTKKMFNYAGLFTLLLESGGVLIIDEFDARFHTNITKAIVKIFNSDKNKLAQLCFVTHDTNLMDKDLLRRDQIYFAEKNTRGESYFYSLSEIKGIRNDASYEKDYIKGKYGAIPFIKNFNSVFE